MSPNGGQAPIYVLKAELFRTLGHPVRVRVLQLLRQGEMTVRALQAALDLDSSGTSQHLAALRKQGLVANRRDGTSIYYRLKDGRTLELLELARQILSANLQENSSLLDELQLEEATPTRRGRGT
jgi:ArsR family transcriptional regulator